jgi:Ca-activated chloride channel homolog
MSASRVLLLATAVLCGAALLSETALAANTASVWSGLWYTPDQQGQALLDAGQPAQAAELFRDPRRRAYADLQAGGYAAAAKLLAPFSDARSEYNRGNALAKSGQLQAALSAYDSALKQAPADRDIRHNRDLVQRALQQQRQRQQQKGQHQSPQSSSRNGRQGSQTGTSQGQQPQSSSSGRQGSSGSRQSGAPQQSRAGSSQAKGGDQTASNGSRAGANQQGNSGQAQRDAAAAAALARAQRQRGAAAKSPEADGLPAGGAQTPKPQPETERQMALDQWLRQIPDSPAGLLRRKFLIEHIIRQQDGGNSQESAQ